MSTNTEAAAAETAATLAEAAIAAGATSEAPNLNFDDAFAAASADEPPSREDEVKTPAAAPKADAQPAATEQPVEGEPAAGEQPAAAAPADDVQKLKDEEFLNRLQNILQTPVGTPPKQEAQPAQPQQAEPAPPQEVLSAEEKALVEGYVKDWPENAKAEALIRKTENVQMVDYIFREVMGYIQKNVVPKLQTVDVLAEAQQATYLQQEIPGFSNEMVEAVAGWVEAQPDFLQDAYQRVITQGTVPQLKKLVERFQAETGWQPPAPQGGAAPAPAPAARRNGELPSTAKQAAASLAPVITKRSAVPQGDDKSDFDGAFAKFAHIE
jgi:hypothetical protein